MNPPSSPTRKLGALLLLAFSAATCAQQTDPPTPSYTFHVATDLIQIPVLVLSQDRTQLPPIDPARFTVSIAGGTPFQPKVRREADDPIALAILVDNSGPQRALVSQLPAALRSALPQTLHAEDRISIESLDHCLLHHLLPPSPPGTEAVIRAIDRATAPPTPAELQERKAKCNGPVKIWDSLAFVVADLGKQPGRHVLLVVANGNDTGSTSTWNQLRLFAGSRAVTIFSLSDPQDSWRRHIDRESYRRGQKEEDVLSELCQLSGGLSLASNPTDLGPTFLNFVAMLRNRYIVEFPRPSHFQSSSNTLEVNVKGAHAFIRASGISFPIPEKPAPSQDVVNKEQPRPVPGNRVTLPPP